MQIVHNNVAFDIDTMDWSDSKCREIAEEELVKGIMALSTHDTHLIAASRTDGDAECQSRNSNDEVAKIVETIERAARMVALAGFMSEPDSGHNCSISVAH